MRLRHWSAEPLGELRSVTPAHRKGYVSPFGKPVGFWLSDESTEWGWKSWCEEEQYNLDGLTCFTDFDVDLSRIRHISNGLGMDQFIAEFGTTEGMPERYRESCYAIDWLRVGAEYKGILITPYQEDFRFDADWYYGWDCASGCFWDVSCLTRVREPAIAEGRT